MREYLPYKETVQILDLQARLLIDSSRKSSNIAPILVKEEEEDEENEREVRCFFFL